MLPGGGYVGTGTGGGRYGGDEPGEGEVRAGAAPGPADGPRRPGAGEGTGGEKGGPADGSLSPGCGIRATLPPALGDDAAPRPVAPLLGAVTGDAG